MLSPFAATGWSWAWFPSTLFIAPYFQLCTSSILTSPQSLLEGLKLYVPTVPSAGCSVRLSPDLSQLLPWLFNSGLKASPALRKPFFLHPALLDCSHLILYLSPVPATLSPSDPQGLMNCLASWGKKKKANHPSSTEQQATEQMWLLHVKNWMATPSGCWGITRISLELVQESQKQVVSLGFFTMEWNEKFTKQKKHFTAVNFLSCNSYEPWSNMKITKGATTCSLHESGKFAA